VFESLWRLSDPVTFVHNPVGRVLFDVSGPSYLGYMERAARVPAARERLSAALAALPVRAAGDPTAAQGDH